MTNNTPLPKHISARELADLLQLTPSRVSGLVRENKIPPATSDGYELKPCVAGYLSSLRKSHTDGSLVQARLRKLKAEAKLAEIQVEQAEKRLVPLDDVGRVWNQACTALRQVILAADIPFGTKEELTRNLREIPVDHFLDGPAAAAGE